MSPLNWSFNGIDSSRGHWQHAKSQTNLSTTNKHKEKAIRLPMEVYLNVADFVIFQYPCCKGITPRFLFLFSSLYQRLTVLATARVSAGQIVPLCSKILYTGKLGCL